jgi:hypothetical protein
MMGRRENGQGQFFYSFDLDEVVPPDHPVRQIDRLLDLSWSTRSWHLISHTGRPSIDPVRMIRMLLVGYILAIRSKRRSCAEIQVNFAYRWFCSVSKTRYLTTPCSAVRGKNASGRAMPCAGSSRVWCRRALWLDWLGAKRFRSRRLPVVADMEDRIIHLRPAAPPARAWVLPAPIRLARRSHRAEAVTELRKVRLVAPTLSSTVTRRKLTR